MSSSTKVKIKSEYITLGQFLKYVDLISFGGEAKLFIQNNDIFVNENLVKERGKKLRPNDVIKIKSMVFEIVDDSRKN